MQEKRKEDVGGRLPDSGAAKSTGETKLPLGAGAFASPLAWPGRQESGTKRHSQAALALAGCAVVAASVVGSALWFRSQSIAAAGRAPAAVLRPEPPAAAAPRAPLPRVNRTPPLQRAPIASALKTTSATGAAAVPAPEATRVVPAQPTVQPLPVRSAESRAPIREARAERKRREASAAPKLPEALTRAQVIAAMQKITPAVNACFGKSRGTAKVTFAVIGKTGRVVGAQVTGKTGKVGSCIARSVRRARFPKFAKPRLEISFPFAR